MHDVTTPARRAARGAILVAGWIWCGCLALIAIAACTSGSWKPPVLIALASVLAAPPIGARLAAKGVAGWMRIVASIVLMIVGIVLAPDFGKTPEKAKSDNAPASAPAPVARSSADDKKLLTAQTIHLYRDFIDQASQCDKAWGVASDALQGGNPYSAYAPVKEAKETCSSASDAIGRMSPPEASSGKARDEFAKALKSCSDAYMVGSMAFDKTLGVLDGNGKPSAVNDVTETMKAAFGGKLMCITSFMGAAGDAGVPLDTLVKAK